MNKPSEHSEGACSPMFETIILNFLGGQNMTKFSIASFAITVEVPMVYYTSIRCTTGDEWRDWFFKEWINAEDSCTKQRYGKYCELINYACSCGGDLAEVKTSDYTFCFTFKFASLASLTSFTDNLSEKM